MDSYYHAKLSAKKWGGKLEDYLPIHEFIDSSKLSHADHRHRALYHHTQGVALCAKIFGSYITNSDGKEVPVKQIAEKHIIEDLNFLPTPEHYLKNMNYADWMSGTRKKNTGPKSKTFSFNDGD